MNTTGVYPISDVLAYLKSWNDSLEIRRKEIYAKYLSGAMSGILLIVVTIGLSFDKLAHFGTLEKTLLGFALLLLITAVGNLMHGMTFSTNAQLELLRYQRYLLLQQTQAVNKDELEQLEQNLVSGRDQTHRYFPYAYWSVVAAIVSAVVGFFIILIKT